MNRMQDVVAGVWNVKSIREGILRDGKHQTSVSGQIMRGEGNCRSGSCIREVATTKGESYEGIISLKLRAFPTKATMATPFAQNSLPIYVAAPGFPPLPSVLHRLSLSLSSSSSSWSIFFLYTPPASAPRLRAAVNFKPGPRQNWNSKATGSRSSTPNALVTRCLREF
jgi:hypothetical protein